jgi:molybdenum cofactor biosynthesis protein MoaC
MIDITEKQISLRTATASGIVKCSPDTIKMVREGTLPKGEPFGIAKAAGLLASKKTQDLIPHCHPVSIDNMDIDFEVKDEGVGIIVKGKSIGRTGIEMEVLTACSVAALTIYDLFKPVDKNIEISSVKLLEKTGGRSQYQKDAKPEYKAAVLTCSDSVFAGQGEDRSGRELQEMLKKHGIEVADYKVVADDLEAIQKQIQAWVHDDIHFIFTTGGTGVGPRDVTVEAVREILEKETPGVAEAMRNFGSARTPRAMLSRSVAGTVAKTMIVTLPGSTKGVRESLSAILPGVFHTREMLLGGKHH